MGGWGAGSLFQIRLLIFKLYFQIFFNFHFKLPKLPKLPIFIFIYIFNTDFILFYTILYKLVLNKYGELYGEL